MATRKGGSFGWFIIGILVGVIVIAGVYVYATRDRTEPAVQPAEAVPPAPPSAVPPPLGGSPEPTPPAAATPAAPVAPAVTPREPTDEERQIADDAAATGMTGPVNPPAEQPIY